MVSGGVGVDDADGGIVIDDAGGVGIGAGGGVRVGDGGMGIGDADGGAGGDDAGSSVGIGQGGGVGTDVGGSAAGVALTTPVGGKEGTASDMSGGESNIRCDDRGRAFLLSIIVSMLLNSVTRIGNACLIHPYDHDQRGGVREYQGLTPFRVKRSEKTSLMIPYWI